MWRRTVVSLVAVIIGIACISNDAFAFRGGVGRPGVGPGGVRHHHHPVARGAAVGATYGR